MDIRQITECFAVSPQIGPGDVPALTEAGFVRVICNRPDSEVPGDEVSEAISGACAAHGIEFRLLPVDHAGLTETLIVSQGEAVETAAGPVLAYCRSGTRSCHVWALSQAGKMDPDTIMAAGARGGYDLALLRPTILRMAAQKG